MERESGVTGLLSAVHVPDGRLFFMFHGSIHVVGSLKLWLVRTPYPVHPTATVKRHRPNKLRVMSSSRAPSTSSVTLFLLFRHCRVCNALYFCVATGGCCCLCWFSTVAAAHLSNDNDDNDLTAMPRWLPWSSMLGMSLSVVVKLIGLTVVPLLLAACVHYVAWQLYLHNV